MAIYRLLLAGFLFCVLPGTSEAQKHAVPTHFNFNIGIPVGNFSDTHLIGAGLAFTPSFTGVLLNRDGSLVLSAKTGFNYYKGKREKTGIYSYQHSSFWTGYLDGELVYSLPAWHTHFSLSAGPAIGFTGSRTIFMMHGSLGVRYFMSDRLSVGPQLELYKEPGTNTLSAIGFQVCYSLF